MDVKAFEIGLDDLLSIVWLFEKRVRMAASLMATAAAFRVALAAVDPEVVSGSDCADWAEELAATEKACGALRLLLSARAVQFGTHRERGFSDGAAWFARHSGSSGRTARQALGTARRLDGCPATKTALRAGEISLGQAGEIAAAQAETPGAEAALLPVARTADLTRLRDEAREHRQAHTDPAELRHQQFRRRHFRHWTDRDGLVCFAGALPPERGLPLVSRIAERANRLVRRAKASGPTGPPIDTFEAYAADALFELLTDSPGRDATATGTSGSAVHSVRADLTLVCDINAYRRGHTHQGEACHIIGGGPIPVSVARALSKDAFLKAVLHDGTDIIKVKHFGRHISAALRTALDLGPVPSFAGRECVDCGSRFGLEYDHLDPVANHGPTSYDNIRARCWADHQAKTDRDRQAGRLGVASGSPRASNPP